jgi:acyl-CoA synthetase (AMP-forming)/AMP-acid ligase II
MFLQAWASGFRTDVVRQPIMTQMTLGSIICENARSAPESVALRCGDTAVTYQELELRTNQLAQAFRDSGVQSGERIVWLGQNCHRWVESLIACAKAGAILCSLNWRLTEVELSEFIKDLSPRLVIWQASEMEGLADKLRPAAADAHWLAHDLDGPTGYESFLASRPTDRPLGEENANAAVLLMGVAHPAGGHSGSLLSHTNLIVPGLVMAKLQDIDRHTVNLVCAPLYHILSLFALVPTVQMRATNVFVRRADAKLICEAISMHRCTHGVVMAPTADAIVEENADGKYNLKSFRSALTNSRWREMVSVDDSPWGRSPGGFGQTETNMAILAALAAGASGTSGAAAPYAEVRIVDPSDSEVSPGQVGEIVVRGPSVHLGYWNRPHDNQRRFRNGWWHTGDLGTRDSRGFLAFVGPIGRLIKTGAENVYAAEVERCLTSHSAVREAAVIGVPDAVWVQSVKAIVVIHGDQTVTAEELQNHCRERIASYKKPRHVVVQTQPLPRKGFAIDYDQVDALHGGGNYPGEGTRSN